MNLRLTRWGGLIRSSLALVAMASAALLLSPAAQAQHMHGFGGGSHFGAQSSGPHQFNRGSGNFSGFRHNGFRHHGGSRFVVIGGFGFGYPFAYPYPYPYYAYPDYDYSMAAPAYNMPPPAPTWYYCDASGAYYPYVTTCQGGWRVVPATPQQ